MPRIFKPGSIGQYFEDGMWTGRLTEVHSSTCFHCGKLTEFPSMKEMMNYVEICRGCMKLICLECAGQGCTPFIKQVEEIEEKLYRWRQRNMLGY